MYTCGLDKAWPSLAKETCLLCICVKDKQQ